MQRRLVYCGRRGGLDSELMRTKKGIDAPVLRIVTDCGALLIVRQKQTKLGSYLSCKIQPLFDDDPQPENVLLRVDQIRALARAAGVE